MDVNENEAGELGTIMRRQSDRMRFANRRKTVNIYTKCHRAEVNLVPGPRPCAVDVLNPSWRITATRSAFWTGFAMYAAKRSLNSVTSTPPLYALTAIIGVVAFLLLVLLIYRAAPSPSTVYKVDRSVNAN